MATNGLFTCRDALKEGVRLREVQPEDAPFLYRLRMHPRDRNVFRDPKPVVYEAHRAMLGRYLGQRSRAHWFIIEAGGNQTVGAIALYRVQSRRGEFGRFVIHRRSRGIGVGKTALLLVMDEARKMGIRALGCEVLAGNRRALRIYRSLGFRLRRIHQEQPFRVFLELAARLEDRL